MFCSERCVTAVVCMCISHYICKCPPSDHVKL